MIETTLQSDTLLKQLDKAVDLKSVNSIKVERQLIEPAKMRLVDSITKRDQEKELKQELPQPALGRRIEQPRVETQTEAKVDSDTIVVLPPKPIQATTTEIVKPEIILPEKKKTRDYPDWSIGVFILALIIFATVRIFFNKYLNQLFNAAFNYPTASRLFRERSLNILHGSIRLEILFYVIFSYFLFQAGIEFGYNYQLSTISTYLIILSAVVIYFIGKRILYYMIGFFAEGLPATREYLFNSNQYYRVLGLVLLPVSLVINFATFPNMKFMFYIGIILILIVYLLLLLRGARILLMKHFSISYLILYLCTLEILPLVFVYKLMLV